MPDWNKEVSFRRRKDAQPKAEAATPFWKKEIGGKKKRKADDDAVSFWKKEIGGKKKQAEPAPAEPSVPFWKKELGGRKKQKAKPKAGDAVPFWKKELGGKKKQAPPPPAPVVVAPEPQPVAAVPHPAPVEEPAEDYGWLTDRLDAYAPPPEPAPAAEPDADEPWPPASDEPVVVAAPWPPPSDDSAPAAAPPPPPRAPAPVAVPAPEPVVAPVPEVVAGPPAKTPFWKKELGGKKKAAAPKPVPVPVPGSETLPFWHRDVSLGKKKEPKQPKAAAGKTPFWKRELGRKAPKAPKEPKQPRVAAEKTPFWKKELSLGKKKAAAAPAPAPKPAKQKSEPFWKRGPSVGGGGGGFSLPALRREKKPKEGGSPRRDKANIVGLKIGASQIAAARVHNNGSAQLVQLAREPLDDGIVVGGELRDVEALAESLKRFFAKHKLPRKGVRLGIANNRIGVRTFEISGIDDKRQLANAIRFRAQETLPIPLEEAVLDWQVLREDLDENGVKSRRVLLVVAYRELVDRYVLACRKAGVRLEGIDLEAFAMLRALTLPSGDDDAPPGAQVVVNVGHDRSTFAVSDGRVCEFTRVLAWGGQNLNVAIARALDLTPSEASPIKHAISLEDDSVALEGVDAERAAAACTAVRSELQAFARELVSSLRFYQNQPGSLGIAEVVITGGTSELLGFVSELSQLVGVEVRVGDPLRRLKLSKKAEEPEHVGSLAVAIGLGIED